MKIKSPRKKSSMKNAMNQTSPQVAKSSDIADVTIRLSPDRSSLSITQKSISPKQTDRTNAYGAYAKPKRSSRRTTLGADAFKAKEAKDVPQVETSSQKSKESYLQFRNQSKQKNTEFYEQILKEHQIKDEPE